MYKTYLPILALFWAGAASAQELSLGSYLTSMDRTAVTFSGRIKYDGGDFTFYDENRDPFGATIDAGRTAREKIEAECSSASWLFSSDDLCTITGSGTVEIRGSRVYISVEQVDQLGN